MTDDQATRRPIRAILDASAIVAFTRESIHVGEIIAEIDDELGAAALPLPGLVEAVHAVADTDRLDILLEHRATVVIADSSTDWRALPTTYDIVGRIDAASAVLAAIDNDCDVLTRQSGLYAGLAGGGPVIPIEE